MVWPTPKYSRNQVTRAGEYLTKQPNVPSNFPELKDWLHAYAVLANWRACHGYPINTFQATLRTRLKKIDEGALVAQRLKRTPSILNKLARFKGMNLARMQDIGGLRAVVASTSQLAVLNESYLSSKLTHELVSQYDYVRHPKPSGYRSIHLVYRYKGRNPTPYDGLQLELQLRTRIQHSWATAVETAGTFLEHSLKSSEGPAEWLSFFALASNAFAYLERTSRVPGFESLSRLETNTRTAAEARRLRVRDMLLGYSTAVREIAPGTRRSAFYLVELNLAQEQKTVTITPFARDQLERANAAYAEAEKLAAQVGNQVVLVSAGSIESLRRAYPNYFLDTHEFLRNLARVERAAQRGTQG
ncbi:MAG: RelA/SpoT domain-containing protein [Piscinibacter sp.]